MHHNSSSSPNLQQIPIRDEYWGPRVRSCFVPRDDMIWVKTDLRQIEFRLGVHYGCGRGIDDVRAAYKADPATNFYKLASGMTGLPMHESKSISLGSLYGMGVKKFCSMVDKPEREARQVFSQYHERLPFLRDTYNYYSDLARAQREGEWGFVTTIGERRCRLSEDLEHLALNRLLQGSCADWIKRSMLDAYEAGIFDVLDLYLTVHDELDVGVPRGSAAGVEALQELHHILCHAYPEMTIPVLAGVDVGRSWGELDSLADLDSLIILV